jgi:hypothetical protein
LASTLGPSIVETRGLLERETIKSLVYADDQGRVRGFGGLAATAMHHRFEVDGRALSTWCAWDSLFIPEILGRPARASSIDPESGEIIRLVITSERIESVEPIGTLMSFIRPDAHVFGTSAANVIAKFCHFIFFFASRSSGERACAHGLGLSERTLLGRKQPHGHTQKPGLRSRSPILASRVLTAACAHWRGLPYPRTGQSMLKQNFVTVSPTAAYRK